MNRVSLFVAIAACTITLQGCDVHDIAGMLSFTDARVNDRFESSMKILESSPVADINAASDRYGMYLVTDIHSDETNDRLERFVSACISETGTEKVVLCLGDLVNGKNQHDRVHSELQPLANAGWRFLNTLGNHDTYFNEFPKFSRYWPLTVYTFRVNLPCGKSDLFICLDTAEASLGTSQRTWVENILKDSVGKYRNIFIFTHTNFFNTDNSQVTSGNYSLEDTYDLLNLFSAYGVTCVLTGHDHHYEHCSFRGVSYYTFNALCNDTGSYYKATFGDDFSFEEIKM